MRWVLVSRVESSLVPREQEREEARFRGAGTRHRIDGQDVTKTLVKMISGGQTGVDQAGLRASRRLGLETGGWAPRGWLTQDGPSETLLRGFGLVESTGSYAYRTGQNVKGSDATVRIANNFFSAGEQCTFKAIKLYSKPWIDFTVSRGGVFTYAGSGTTASSHDTLARFLKRHNVRVLNVAGNSERTSPGIGAFAEEFLVESLS